MSINVTVSNKMVRAFYYYIPSVLIVRLITLYAPIEHILSKVKTFANLKSTKSTN